MVIPRNSLVRKLLASLLVLVGLRWMSSLDQTWFSRRILVNEDRSLIPGLRIAVLGESDSWGAGLKRRHDAYPYQLSSQNVVNYAFYNAGPNYAAVCTNTLIGDEKMFDVIVIEHYLRSIEGLVGLATRLRARCPKALIVFVKLWKPFMVARSLENFTGDGQDPDGYEYLDEWTTRLGIQDGHVLLSILKDTEGKWYFPVHQDSEDALAEAVEVASGHVIELPSLEDARDTIAAYSGWFDFKYGLLQEVAHKHIANEINEVIEKHAPSIGDAIYGSWGHGDACHVWFETGACNLNHSESLEMNEYDDMEGNFALEVPTEEGGWIMVHNPFDTERRLFLSYIATDGSSHPRTNVTIGDSSSIVDPGRSVDMRHVHPIKTTSVGHVQPGEQLVQLQPLEKTKYKFRLVGASFTDEENVPDVHAFSPLMRYKV